MRKLANQNYIEKIYVPNAQMNQVIDSKLQEVVNTKYIYENKEDESSVRYSSLVEGFVDASMTSITTNSVDISNNLTTIQNSFGNVAQDIQDKSTGKLTEYDGALEDAKNLILMQNTVYTIGTLAISSLLISTVLFMKDG